MTAIAVLTGDLIGSTAHSAASIDAAFQAIQSAAASVGLWQGEMPAVARSRGDGWQMRMVVPAQALRVALLVRARLTGSGPVGTRLAIAVGDEDAAPAGDLNRATGAVYVASGRALDGLRGPATFVHAGGGAIGAAVRLADHISQRWTPAQAQVVAWMLPPDPPTHTEVAGKLEISRQAVDQALAAAGWPALSQALLMIEAPA